MNSTTEELLRVVADWKGIPDNAAYNIREDTGCAGRHSTEHVKIESKTDKPGIDIRVLPGTRGRDPPLDEGEDSLGGQGQGDD